MNTVSSVGIQPPVHQGHLHLVLEVRDGAQAAHDHARLLDARVVDEQAAEGVHLDVRQVGEDLAGQSRSAPSTWKQRRLLDVHEDRHDDALEQARAARDDVDVAVGQRVEGPGIDRHLVAAGRVHASPSEASRAGGPPCVERQRAVTGHEASHPGQSRDGVRRVASDRVFQGEQPAGCQAPTRQFQRFAHLLEVVRRVQEHEIEATARDSQGPRPGRPARR